MDWNFFFLTDKISPAKLLNFRDECFHETKA